MNGLVAVDYKRMARARQHQAVLPQDARVGSGRAGGAGRHRHPGMRRPQRLRRFIQLGVPVVTGDGFPDEIITGEQPPLCDEARIAGVSRTTSINWVIAAMSRSMAARRTVSIHSLAVGRPYSRTSS